MLKLKTLTGMVLGVCLVLPADAQGPSQPAGGSRAPMALTAMDYIEIEQLVAKYSRAIDSCSNNGYDYADLFAPDGFFLPVINGKPLNRMQGREALAAASGGGRLGCKNVGWIQQGIRHLYPNHVITPTADGATGVVDMLMIGLGGDPNKIEYDGYYEDVYVKTAQGWRFQARTHHAVLVEGKRATPPAGATSPPGTSR
jgi:hypothetical protein